MDIFEKATREKTRFAYKGFLSVEDLWDLPLMDLDRIFKSLNGKLRMTKEDSLLEIKDKADTALEFQIAIIKHIVEIKLQEMAAREALVEKREKKQKLMGILAAKQDESLKNMSEEDLKKMLEAL